MAETIRKVTLPFAVVVLIVCAAAAQDAANEVKPEDKCSIEGNVYDTKTGEPIRKATIRLHPAERSGSNSYGTLTDATGHYTVGDVNPGRYYMATERNGYVNGGNRFSRMLTLQKGERLKDLNVRLQRQAVVTGRVVDEDNEPMANVSVQLMRQTYREGRSTIELAFGDRTDDRGEYRVHGVIAGKYYAVAINGVGRFQQQPVISRDKEGSYVPVYYPNSAGLAGASQITATAGMETPGIDFRLRRVRTYRISGKISNAPPNGWTMVMLGSRDAGDPLARETTRRQRTDAHGRFVFQDVMPGSYRITAQLASGGVPQIAMAAADVGETNVDGVVMTFTALPDVAGSVSTEGLDLKGLGMQVMLMPEDRGMKMGGGAAQIAADGTFKVTQIAPARYRVRVGGLPDGSYLKSVMVGPTEAPDGVVDFSGGAAGEITLVISGKAAEVSGSVRTKDAPAAGSTVVLVPDERSRYSEYKWVVADQNGSFVLKSVPPGNYKLFAWEKVENDAWTDPEFLQPFEDRGEAVVVREGDKLTKDLKLIESGDTPASSNQ